MKRVSVYILLSVLVTSVQCDDMNDFVTMSQQQQSQYCDSFNEMTTFAGVQADVPSLPQIPNTFQTNVEINMIENNSTMDVIEFFDNIGNRATLVTTSNGIQGRAIFDYETNELFIVTNGICMVSTLSNNIYADLFGVTNQDELTHIMSSNTALKFGQTYGEKYMGKSVVRGISVNHWQACLHWARKDANFTVDYYFSDPKRWNTSSDFLSVPVRADVQGITNTPDGWTPFHHIYDYYAFRPYAGDNSNFQTPPGAICDGRQKSQRVPTLPKQFYYRQELVSPADGYMTYFDVWYDEAFRLVRTDSRPQSAGPPFYNLNPITQIEDFNGGVKYIKDNMLGNCTIMPLDNSTFGVMENQTLLHRNGSFVLQMENPLRLFDINKNFTFVGQRECRNLMCDVFSARVNMQISGRSTPAKAIVEAFFLSPDMHVAPNHGMIEEGEAIPIKMTVNIDEIALYSVYNMVDYDSSHPDLSTFDISSCYSQTSKIHFNVRFPALYKQDTADIFKLKTRLLLAETMSISPIRIADVRVEHDLGDVFLYATLLDRTPATSQFSYITNSEIEKHDDTVIPTTTSPMECATFCVDLTNITCNSFDYCPHDPTGTCRLSRSHVGDGTAVLINSSCWHYSRNVNAPREPERTMLEAYAALRIAVYNQKFALFIGEDNDQFRTLASRPKECIWKHRFPMISGIGCYGMVLPVAMPKLSGQFSYSQEVTMPFIAQVYNSKVWYDSDYKMVRYDFHLSKPTPPFYSVNPMTVIHDFNTGVSYTIDNFYQNCTVAPINTFSIDSELDPKAAAAYGAYVVQMKNPLEMFHLSNNYKFVGQKTIRDKLCSGYEILVENFMMPGLAQGKYQALLRYFFLQSGWTEVADDGADLTFNELVRMEITIMQDGLFFTYDFFDFEERHPDLSVFDIRKCFSEANQHHLQIQFPGHYHPYLDIYSKIFQVKSQMAMAQASGASFIRFQDTHVDYDEDNIYVTSTLLGRNPYMVGYTLIPGNVVPTKSDVEVANIKKAVDCADICSSFNSFPCNSFDYCPQANYCFLNKRHVDSGPKDDFNMSCFHYSKTVNDTTVPSPSMQVAYIHIKNAVYRGNFNISIPNGEMAKVFSASAIRDDIVRPSATTQQTRDIMTGATCGAGDTHSSGTPDLAFGFCEGRILTRYVQMRNSVLSVKADDTQSGVAVDDCAAACLREDLFDCQSFSYCYNIGACTLSTVHPDENMQLVKSSSACDLFSRKYLGSYSELPGKVFKTKAILETTAFTDNMCAKKCTLSHIVCKSFDYCASTQSCLLRRNHTLDVPTSFLAPSPSCNHYTKNYLYDFKKSAGKKIKFGPNLLFRGVSVEQCAKACVEEESMNCHSFDFCSNTSSCMIRQLGPRRAPPGSIVISATCNLYSRMFFPGRSTHVSPTLPPYHRPDNTGGCGSTGAKTGNDNSSSNAGAYVGVAFGVFFPGLILGAFIVNMYRKYKDKRDNDEMGVHFVRDNTELT